MPKLTLKVTTTDADEVLFLDEFFASRLQINANMMQAMTHIKCKKLDKEVEKKYMDNNNYKKWIDKNINTLKEFL
jgi:hypothetical protein